MILNDEQICAIRRVNTCGFGGKQNSRRNDDSGIRQIGSPRLTDRQGYPGTAQLSFQRLHDINKLLPFHLKTEVLEGGIINVTYRP